MLLRPVVYNSWKLLLKSHFWKCLRENGHYGLLQTSIDANLEALKKIFLVH